MVGREVLGVIVCWQQFVLGRLDKAWQRKELGNCVLTTDCVRGIE